MGLMIASEPMTSIPLTVSDDDVIYVGKTRVTLDTVVYAFQEGATPEEIVYQYPSLSLGDVYAVVGYFLHHRAEVQAYLEQREMQATQVRSESEARFASEGVRERLMARRPKE